ncbi:helix-turn-helix transcriptional regulator [Pseudonocardia sp. EV170527-09]|uniref:helix-turn-helix domain-containing protein n=1 Tax=Pseudonocardia sp. EV170527-09 TaxID=2603411 RepID=UPI0011F1656A|nr:helix-turn-helix transcriptional regulator [Pseudonocardia sp. EV170527-09]KAA1015485.1 helix-turn-helix transcriptional regulator [Pseudonocardia sp. EV170527-09]
MTSVGTCAHPSWISSLSLVDTLTEREREVFSWLAEGSSNQEIADELFITERTVRAHLGEIMRKLRLDSRLRACLVSYVHHSLSAPADLPVALS